MFIFICFSHSIESILICISGNHFANGQCFTNCTCTPPGLNLANYDSVVCSGLTRVPANFSAYFWNSTTTKTTITTLYVSLKFVAFQFVRNAVRESAKSGFQSCCDDAFFGLGASRHHQPVHDDAGTLDGTQSRPSKQAHLLELPARTCKSQLRREARESRERACGLLGGPAQVCTCTCTCTCGVSSGGY